MKLGGKIVKIQKISFSNFNRTSYPNFAGINRKVVQNDSFINACPKYHKSNGIEDYLRLSKKEVKNLQQNAREYYRQYIRLLKLGGKSGFSKMIQSSNYNVTFGEVDKKSALPNSVNLWKDGKLVKAFVNRSFEPIPYFEVYDTESKNLVEEYTIIGKNLISYIAKKPKEKEITVIFPSESGFYKTEGTYKNNSIKKTREIEYYNGKDAENTYFEYDNDSSRGYTYDTKSGHWVRNNVEKKGILKITSF